ncbi:lysozyme inhibitor LprI family protein [Rhizobium leguminosarum]|uniref:lysozyme inhibitor LprI family protein n=1 Tax=Rhizobium TaxID=379 RepID=UPI0013EEA75D|nr:lysozyme inhibitor LprI family protein [Rhizobium leguminosarum]
MKITVSMMGLFFVAGSALPSQAADCDEAMSQTTLSACAARDFKEADTKLNIAVNRAMQRVRQDTEKSDLLTGAQRDWTGFRESQCLFESSDIEDGSAAPMVRFMCLTRMTQARSKEIEPLLNCQEGDLSCALSSEGD